MLRPAGTAAVLALRCAARGAADGPARGAEGQVRAAAAASRGGEAGGGRSAPAAVACGDCPRFGRTGLSRGERRC